MNDIGVPPHPLPWPKGAQYDEELLRNGDSRNVLDVYRYWKVGAIKADLDSKRFSLEIAVENVSRDFNMGTIVRNANAFNVSKVHIIGRRQWNKRGAMVTDVYMNIEYHESAEVFAKEMKDRQKQVIGVDIIDGAQPIHSALLPENAVLVFGAEGPGLSEELIKTAETIVCIEQFGSTRSVNVGVASGIAMYCWMQQNILS